MSERPSDDGRAVPRRTFRDLAAEYDALLLDAYGVLVDARGPLPGAADALDHLQRTGTPFLVLTNDASRRLDTWVERFAGFGLAVPAEAIVTSASLLAPYFAERRLAGARCLVLGPEDSAAWVSEAGGEPLPADPAGRYDAYVVCDERGYPFLETVEAAVSSLFAALDAGREPALVLPNPDLLYPKSAGEYGFTSGAVARLVEDALEHRYPGRGLAFDRLGKPHPPIFAEARRRLARPEPARHQPARQRLLMIGDQLATDVAGALAAGIDAALVDGGVSRWEGAGAGGAAGAVRPTWRVAGLALDG